MKRVIVGIMLVQVMALLADGDVAIGNMTSVKGGSSSLAAEHVGRGLAFREQMSIGKDVDIVAARARTEFMLALMIDNRNAEAYYQLGCLYQDTFGYAENALEMYMLFTRLADKFDERVKEVQCKVVPELREKIAMSSAKSPGAASRDRYDILLKTGNIAMKNGMFLHAADTFSQLVAQFPQDYRAIDALIAALYKVGCVEKANVYGLYRAKIQDFRGKVESGEKQTSNVGECRSKELHKK